MSLETYKLETKTNFAAMNLNFRHNNERKEFWFQIRLI